MLATSDDANRLGLLEPRRYCTVTPEAPLLERLAVGKHSRFERPTTVALICWIPTKETRCLNISTQLESRHRERGTPLRQMAASSVLSLPSRFEVFYLFKVVQYHPKQDENRLSKFVGQQAGCRFASHRSCAWCRSISQLSARGAGTTMKAARTDTLTSQQAPIELYSEDSGSWMITDSPQDESPFPMVYEDQKMRYNPIMRNWADVSPIQEKVGGLLSTGMYATSIYFAGNYGRSWDWRRTAAVTMVCYVSLDAFVKLLTIWDIIRSPYFWLGIPILEQIPLGVIFIVSSFIIVELATEGHEGAMYGLLTTVYNLAIPFATTITRNVDSMFNLTTERIQNDTNSVRTDMTMTVLIMWTTNLCSLLFLVMLPRQKEQTRAMKQLGGSSYFMGVVTVSYLMFALLWTTTTSLLSIFPSTSCLVIAGGNGCDNKPVRP
ncbi:hypothetical protein PC122_g3799 [Phytophthora cactorum]|nr:hypothetical protein PC122_g3799 [Phytophthora cactorum]